MHIKYLKSFFILMVIASISFSSVYAIEDNFLYFDENNGELFYETNGKPNSQFIVNENMTPRVPYVNTLRVGNKSQHDYDLYLNLLSKESISDIEEKFLKMIKMKIYFNQELVYEGEALGALNKILLGNLNSSSEYQLRVETILEMDITTVKEEGYYVKSAYMDYKGGGAKPTIYSSQEEAKVAALQNGEDEIIYASLGYLTSEEFEDISLVEADTNWQFYAQRTNQDTPMEEIKPGPDTGDTTDGMIYLKLIGLAGLFGIYMVFKKPKEAS